MNRDLEPKDKENINDLFSQQDEPYTNVENEATEVAADDASDNAVTDGAACPTGDGFTPEAADAAEESLREGDALDLRKAAEYEQAEAELLDSDSQADTPVEAHASEGTNEILTISDPRQLKGMYRNWFLEYASYTILERAVPHIDDGLKPVQRRILHSMKTLDDGRFNKVANIVGNTMQYHPHGDASIYGALVQLGQKNLTIETQGNWGNILTGASAAAGRYIEARLSPFALDTLYNPKVTEWTLSYDGRKKEPVSLPSKYPLLLAQGADGIAVGLSSKILPHNFNEIIDAATAYLRGEDFELYPDFVTGGLIDVSKYNDGRRGGSVKIRAKIEKIDSRTLCVTEIPYGLTTPSIIESIQKASEKGKIKIRRVDDNTAKTAAIMVYLQPGTSSDKAIDALYAFTDCEINISPNCCVIRDRKPCFLGVSDVLRHNVDTTVHILRTELEIELSELKEKLFFASLEKIFITEGIYKDPEYEQARNIDAAVKHIAARLKPFAGEFFRKITRDDILKLVEIRMKRIFKFSKDEADREIAELNKKIDGVNRELADITGYTIAWFERLKEKYGEDFPRHTVIRGFDSIEASRVAEANEKLYINREDGFIGTALKGGAGDEFVCNCSTLDDVIVFYKDGGYKVIKVAEKVSVGKNVIYVNVFKHKDLRTIYNVIYRNGANGPYYMKRCAVTGVTREKLYDLTPGKPGTRIMWFSANPNGEAETVRITLKPKLRLKALQFEVDFSTLAVKGKQSQGNLVTKNEIQRITLKERGVSTLGGRQVWFDHDVLRLNYEGRGMLLGEFSGDDRILVVLKNGEFYTTDYSLSNHFDDNILRLEKFDRNTVFTAIVNDADQGGYPYLKRFAFELSNRHQSFIGENARSQLLLLTSQKSPRFSITFAAPDDFRPALEVDASEFVGVKSFKAKGKRLTTFNVGEITELEPSPSTEEEKAPASIDAVIGEDETPADASEPITDDSRSPEEDSQGSLFD